MRLPCRMLLAVTLFLATLASPLHAQVPRQLMSDDAQIRNVLTKQAEDWNHGNLDAFATGYKKSPDIVFMGSTISRGYDQMLASYKQHYPTRGKMGALIFSDIEVNLLDAKYATVLGRFQLQRLAADGGDAQGYFSLVFEKTFDGWKIILDHTTNTAKK